MKGSSSSSEWDVGRNKRIFGQLPWRSVPAWSMSLRVGVKVWWCWPCECMEHEKKEHGGVRPTVSKREEGVLEFLEEEKTTWFLGWWEIWFLQLWMERRRGIDGYMFNIGCLEVGKGKSITWCRYRRQEDNLIYKLSTFAFKLNITY